MLARATKRPLQFYLIAVVLHFSNNLSALFGQFWFVGGAPAVAVTYFLSWHLYHKTKDRTVDEQKIRT